LVVIFLALRVRSELAGFCIAKTYREFGVAQPQKRKRVAFSFLGKRKSPDNKSGRYLALTFL